MLGSVQHPAIALTNSSGCDGGGVGPGRGLGEGTEKVARHEQPAADMSQSARRCLPAGFHTHCRKRGGSEYRWCDRTAPRRSSSREPADRHHHIQSGYSQHKAERLRLRPDLGSQFIGKVTCLLDRASSGRNSVSTKLRMVATSRRCSSVGEKSIRNIPSSPRHRRQYRRHGYGAPHRRTGTRQAPPCPRAGQAGECPRPACVRREHRQC